MSLEDLIGGWAATLKKICSSIGIIIAVYRSSISWNWNLLETIHQLFLENRSFYFSNQKTISLTEKRWLYCPNLSCGHHLFSVLREVLRGLAGSQWREILWNLGFSEECPKKKPQWWRPKVINYNVCLLHRGKPFLSPELSSQTSEWGCLEAKPACGVVLHDCYMLHNVST